MHKSSIVIFLCLCLSFDSFAQGIFTRSGYDMSYECLGNVSDTSNLYQINYVRYQPCLSHETDGDLQILEGPTIVGILSEDFDSVNIVIETVINPIYDCILKIPEVCLTKKKLSWSIELPISDEGYIFFKEWVSRSGELVNVIPPIIGPGSTYHGFGTFIELTPLAQVS